MRARQASNARLPYEEAPSKLVTFGAPVVLAVGAAAPAHAAAAGLVRIERMRSVGLEWRHVTLFHALALHALCKRRGRPQAPSLEELKSKVRWHATACVGSPALPAKAARSLSSSFFSCATWAAHPSSLPPACTPTLTLLSLAILHAPFAHSPLSSVHQPARSFVPPPQVAHLTEKLQQAEAQHVHDMRGMGGDPRAFSLLSAAVWGTWPGVCACVCVCVCVVACVCMCV